MKARGIPVPGKDIESMYRTLEALRESVESNAQGLRDRTLRTTNRAQAVTTLNDNVSSAANARLISDMQKQLADLEARVTALETP